MRAPAVTPTSDCCGKSLAMDMDDGGVFMHSCRKCDSDLCSGCAALWEVDGGYGEDGREMRVYALCGDCKVVGK